MMRMYCAKLLENAPSEELEFLRTMNRIREHQDSARILPLIWNRCCYLRIKPKQRQAVLESNGIQKRLTTPIF